MSRDIEVISISTGYKSEIITKMMIKKKPFIVITKGRYHSFCLFEYNVFFASADISLNEIRDILYQGKAASLARLSQREIHIIKKTLSGDSEFKISQDIGISQKTVSTHKSNIKQKTTIKRLKDLICVFNFMISQELIKLVSICT